MLRTLLDHNSDYAMLKTSKSKMFRWTGRAPTRIHKTGCYPCVDIRPMPNFSRHQTLPSVTATADRGEVPTSPRSHHQACQGLSISFIRCAPFGLPVPPGSGRNASSAMAFDHAFNAYSKVRSRAPACCLLVTQTSTVPPIDLQ